MSMERVHMKNLRELIRIKFNSKLTNRQIGAALNISASTVSYYARAIISANLTQDRADALDDNELIAAIEPFAKQLTQTRLFKNKIDLQNVHKEMQKKHVTLTLLYEEYLKNTTEHNISYSNFCRQYRKFKKSNKINMIISHKAGDKSFIDYCGDTIPIYSRSSKEIKHAQIFLMVLGLSNYTFSTATWTQNLEDWIAAHVNAFEFFEGVSALLVPDNLKSAINNSCKYDPISNPTYADMAKHYNTAILPARPYTPKDKAKVENGVLIVERFIMARLRNQKFYSLAALNNSIKQILQSLNNKPFQKREGSRYSQFLELEKPALQPLPKNKYFFAKFKTLKVAHNYHVCLDNNYYSVPYDLIAEFVECRYTSTTVEILYKNKRIATHVRLEGKDNKSTQLQHMPTAHVKYSQWSEQKFLDWGFKMGSFVHNLIIEVIANKKHSSQSQRFHMGIIHLIKIYGSERVNNACARALATNAIDYHSILSILKTSLDRQPIILDG
jgi:transposase